ncbi:MAG: hypothetical protein ACXWCY_26895 [Burkholderiales bacterium]
MREFQNLEFGDPRPFLLRLAQLEPMVAQSDLPDDAKALRVHSLKWARELREAALFCYGMAQRIRETVHLAPSEAQDYDFVATWIYEGSRHFSPVQLKEVVPQELNGCASVQYTVNALSKYVDSADVTVAIHLNRAIHFDPEGLSIPPLNIGALWVFGAVSEDRRAWGLWGNLLETRQGTRFDYPT